MTTVLDPPATNTRTLMEIIDRAHQLIQDGWIQGKAHTIDRQHNHHYCLMGAVFNASAAVADEQTQTHIERRKNYYRDRTAVMDHLANLLGTPTTTGVWRWNDKPGRTKQEVLQLLEQAADTL